MEKDWKFSHIAFEVADLQQASEIMAAKGIPVAFHIRDAATYYDTRIYGNMLLELLQRTP